MTNKIVMVNLLKIVLLNLKLNVSIIPKPTETKKKTYRYISALTRLADNK